MFVAIAVDVGLLYAARTQSQRAADAGALAGAQVFTYLPADSDTEDVAENYAKKLAMANATLGQQITDLEVTAVADAVNRRVTVTVARNEPTVFAKIFNVNTAAVTTTAVAEASDTATAGTCVKPIFIPNTLPAPDGMSMADACAMGYYLINPNTLQETQWATDLLGTLQTIKPGNPSNSLVPSQYFVIQVACAGHDCVRDSWSYCSPDQFQCLNQYPVQTGDGAGPTSQGVTALLNSPPDTWAGPGDYLLNGSSTHVTSSRQVALTPIADMCPFAANGFPNGNANLRIVGFAGVFVDGLAPAGNGNGGGGNNGGGNNGGGNNGGNNSTGGQADVQAHLLSAVGCKSLLDAAPDVTGAGTLAIPLRLVRTQ
jgi:Flp pilus assembly protein TadG